MDPAGWYKRVNEHYDAEGGYVEPTYVKLKWQEHYAAIFSVVLVCILVGTIAAYSRALWTRDALETGLKTQLLNRPTISDIQTAEQKGVGEGKNSVVNHAAAVYWNLNDFGSAVGDCAATISGKYFYRQARCLATINAYFEEDCAAGGAGENMSHDAVWETCLSIASRYGPGDSGFQQ